MKRSTSENIQSSLPTFIASLGNYFKSLIDIDSKKDLIDTASGSIGFLIQLFGKPLIDKYFEVKSQKRLSNYGFDTYARAAFVQTLQSLEFIKEDLPNDIPFKEAILGTELNFSSSISTLEKKLTILVFQPKYHPAVQMVKNMAVEVLGKLIDNRQIVNSFKKNFNSNIEHCVKEVFGDDYSKHIKKVEKDWLQDAETKFLLDIIDNSKIGFIESEYLKYEDAYGAWAPVSGKNVFEEYESVEEADEFELTLNKVEAQIDEYFTEDSENNIDKILFIISDFGKGKSIFLKHYAANLAKNYIETGEGRFPVYFNLRSYSKYSSNTTQFGVIEDFLHTEYGINISSEYFKNKRYVFLIDSLDESCDLSKHEVEKVVNSIKRIQSLDKTNLRSNQLIITSRPFDEALLTQIRNNKPYIIKDENQRPIGHYITLYGFKKDQFNDWIYKTLSSVISSIDLNSLSGFAAKLLSDINDEARPDIYDNLLANKTLSASELRRPIFAYMIYQLIINDINITKIGKVGIYLSFLNLLSKEAKHINDPSVRVCLQEQIEARNILHHTAALWLYERQHGKQGFLKKADVCRMIMVDFDKKDNDYEILEKYKKSGGNDIQFLSHSYFGEENNILHFQHQSFAEILLAEYYIKVLIKCALDRPVNIDFVISKLKIGLPTAQTIEFFTELLTLIKESAVNEVTTEIIEKRRLLFPLFASISIHTNNKDLFSQPLHYEWYKRGGINKETDEIPNQLLTSWCVDNNVTKEIIAICEDIINTDKSYLLSKSSSLTPLIDNEITFISNESFTNSIKLEKYLALIVGNTLYNETGLFFIRKISTSKIFQLLKENNYVWARTAFRGSYFKENSDGKRFLSTGVIYKTGAVYSYLIISNHTLSNSHFENVAFANCLFNNCKFNGSTFKNVEFAGCKILRCDFSNCEITERFELRRSMIDSFGPLPQALTNAVTRALNKTLKPNDDDEQKIVLFGERRLPFNNVYIFQTKGDLRRYFDSVKFYLYYALKNKYMSEASMANFFSTHNAKYSELIKAYIKSIHETGKLS